MGAKSDFFETALLKCVFNGSAITNVCSSGGSTSLWVGLHTVDPGDTASTANEGGYTAYARTLTDRSTAANGWTITSGSSNTGASAQPVGTISAPAVATTSTGTFVSASIWPSSNATSTQMLYYGSLSPSINFGSGVTPQITTGSSITEE